MTHSFLWHCQKRCHFFCPFLLDYEKNLKNFSKTFEVNPKNLPWVVRGKKPPFPEKGLNIENWIANHRVHSLYTEHRQRYAKTTRKRSFRLVKSVERESLLPDVELLSTMRRHIQGTMILPNEGPARKDRGWDSHEAVKHTAARWFPERWSDRMIHRRGHVINTADYMLFCTANQKGGTSWEVQRKPDASRIAANVSAISKFFPTEPSNRSAALWKRKRLLRMSRVRKASCSLYGRDNGGATCSSLMTLSRSLRKTDCLINRY